MKIRTLALLGLILAPFSAAAQSCPPASTPNFTAPGNVFGRIASQWNSYFAAKADANGGTLCNVTFQGGINLTYQEIITALGYVPVNKAGDTMTGALGIGATAQNELSVKSPTVLVPGTSGTYAFSAGNSNTEDFTVGSDVTNTYVQTWLGKPLVINGQGNNVLFNPSRNATNVGIGTSNPQSIFQVTAGTPSTTGYSRFTTSDYVDGSVGSGLWFLSGANTGNTWSALNAFSAGNSASASLALNTNGGNVGIGTTSPGSLLTLHNAGAKNMLEISMNPSGAGESHVILESGGGVAMSRYMTNVTSGAFNPLTQIGDTYIGFWGTGGLQDTGGIVLGPGSGSAKGMRIDGVTGNVGIGTGAPAALLSIANGANDSNDYGQAFQITNANGNRQQIAFIRNGNNVISAGYNGASAVWGFGTGNTTDASFTPNFLAIDQTNNRVGINTANPSQALSVQGNAVLGTGGGSLLFRNNANNGDVVALGVNNSDNILYMYSRGSGVHWQSFGNSTLAILDDAGKFAIGSVTPFEIFNVNVHSGFNLRATYQSIGTPGVQVEAGNDAGGAAVPLYLAGSEIHLGDPTFATTQSNGDNSSKVATDAFVQNAVGAAIGFASINNINFTANGTYTPSANMMYAVITCVGGGGGGGGTATAPSSTLSIGGGGGGGGVGIARVSKASVGASQIVTIGGGGAGGTAGNNSGQTGFTTSVGSLCQATGGGGGAGNSGSDVGGAVAGGTAAFGEPFAGQAGQGRWSATAVAPYGAGGNTALGYGWGGAGNVTTGVGFGGQGYGGGGAGGKSFNAGGAEAGAAGTGGYVSITEFLHS